MGHKVHPTGFRVGIIKDWQSKWYSDAHYAEFVIEDYKLRHDIRSKYNEAGISLIEIDRQAKDVTVTLHTARPGIVIGRGGQRVDEMRQHLEGLIGKKIRLNIQEIRQPEMDAYLVARSVAEQIERRVAYRRAIKQAIFRTIQAGAKGIKISCSGRLGNAEIARRQTSHQGQVPLHTLRADIDYGFTEAATTLGRIGVKVWIYKGQILPELKTPEAEAKPAEVAVEAVAVAAPVVQEKPAAPVAVAVPLIIPPAPPLEVVEKPAARPRVRKIVKPAEETAPATKEPEAKTAKPKTVEAKAEAKEPEVKTARPKAAAEKPVEAKAEETPAAPKRKRKPAPAEAETPAAKPAAEVKPARAPGKKEKEG